MDNLRGALLMVLAMLGFALEDAVIKVLSASLPVGQILMGIGLGGALVLGIWAMALGQVPFRLRFLTGNSGLRALLEGLAALGFVSALALVPLSVVTTIIQANPLLVTLGAALFLGETVGIRRWSAIAVGLGGVLLVLRPFGTEFDTAALFAVGGVLAMSARDLVTRRIKREITTIQLSIVGFLASVPAGIVALAIAGTAPVLPTTQGWLLLATAIAFGIPSIYCIIAAMRIGDVSFVAPFRYSRIVFGLSLGVLVFSEELDALVLCGAAIIAASGLYTFWRERKQRHAPLSNTPGPV
ncbi:DMT family transporter [Sulfitobacter sp. HNIBRBA3233]|uniref:DMT family transporter n=1 Tax=Sulfitobacter marinivivus TaxID=3158558 RepID=UPI0032DF2232